MASGHFDERVQMAGVAVNAVGRDQTHEMQGMPVAPAPRHRVDERRFVEEISVADALVDARQVLVDDPSRTHGDVPDFRVAHLSGRKSDLLSGCLKRRMRKTIEQLEVARCSRQLDGVACRLFAQPPPIQYDENEWPGHLHERAESWRMAWRPAYRPPFPSAS